MKRFVKSTARHQFALLPESLDDYVDADNPVRVIDVFVDEINLVNLGFTRAAPATTGRPSYHPATLLKIYIYGYLNPSLYTQLDTCGNDGGVKKKPQGGC